jgi:peptidoglycan/xylan/chitin deacetylase (PgdA/CDA1 family)
MKSYKITKSGKIVLSSFILIAILIICNMGFGVISKTSIYKQIVSKETVFSYKTVYGVQKVYTVNNNIETIDKPNISDGITPNLGELKNMSLDNTQQLIYPVEAAYLNDGKKIAFLSFDDGPSQTTDKILDILKRYGIKATFFIIGSSAEKFPDTLKKIAEDGHTIGNHTYTHDYKTIYSDVNVFMDEVKKTDGILQNVLGDSFHTRLFRFPGGSFEAEKQPFRQELIKEGYVNIDWNALSGDGEGTNIPADKLYNRLVNTAGKQQHLVILMHDSSTKQTTVEALPRIIEYLKAQNYEFATLS